MQQKQCTKCLIEKSVKDFYVNPNNPEKYRAQCKQCLNAPDAAVEVVRKTCSKCQVEKDSTEYFKRKLSKDGLQPICKPCKKQKDADHYKDNRSKRIDQVTQYRKDNREAYNAYRRDLQRRKEATNINYKLRRRLRSRLYNALNGQFKAGSAVQLLGCTVTELRHHIEAQFQEGMTWKNWGKWHIDHIKPLADFDLTDSEQLAQACHYTNLRPLWGVENMSRGATSRFL